MTERDKTGSPHIFMVEQQDLFFSTGYITHSKVLTDEKGKRWANDMRGDLCGSTCAVLHCRTYLNIRT